MWRNPSMNDLGARPLRKSERWAEDDARERAWSVGGMRLPLEGSLVGRHSPS